MMSTAEGRGHHKIFLGMAAGVGKTYRMLQEGQAEAEDGRDVVIGYLEPHDRPATAAQAAGLEVIPRRGYTYRGTRMEDMDVEAIIGRAPELCLIDELAHTNAPGGRHEKRYQDVEDVLAAGIDVYSTVNVQHLESLNDQVTELTGVRVRETLPDAILADADEVVLVDITPQSLLERLRAGKVYKPAAVQAALQGFFKVENLAALREVALRQVAEEVEAKRLPPSSTPLSGAARAGRERLLAAQAQQAIGERLLALITPEPRSQRIVRRAWRSAQRLGAELDVLWVSRSQPSADEGTQLDALRRLTSVLGAHMIVEYGDDVALVTQRVARERGTTYILIGTPHQRGMFSRAFSASLPSKLLELLPGTDVRIVADRTEHPEARRTGPRDERVLAETAELPHPAVDAANGVAAAATGRPVKSEIPPRANKKEGEGPRILFPFDAQGLVERALSTTLRVARAESGTLVPVFLARVPMDLPLDCVLPRQSQLAAMMQETIEQQARQAGVPVDSRIERGRTYRHAMQQMIDHESYDRIVVPAAAGDEAGFGAADVAWLLAHAPGEILVLRPAPQE